MSTAARRKKKATNKLNSVPQIILSADEGDVDKIVELIKADPTCVHAVNKSNWTALHQAAHAGEEGVIEELLEAKANINAVCKDGCTPLMYASAQGFNDVIEQLWKAGALLDIKDNDGDCAKSVARKKATGRFITELLGKQRPAPEEKKEQVVKEEAATAAAVEELASGVEGVAIVGGKMCFGCGTKQPKVNFSKSQLKKTGAAAQKRNCLKCAAAIQAAEAK